MCKEGIKIGRNTQVDFASVVAISGGGWNSVFKGAADRITVVMTRAQAGGAGNDEISILAFQSGINFVPLCSVSAFNPYAKVEVCTHGIGVTAELFTRTFGASDVACLFMATRLILPLEEI